MILKLLYLSLKPLAKQYQLSKSICLLHTTTYFRFHLLHEREANEKFLEAMLLIADVKEATETRTQPADYHY